MPHKTRFHELAHVLLGHTNEGTLNDDERTPRNLRECEAESVALLCLAALDLPGIDLPPIGQFLKIIHNDGDLASI